MKPKEWKSAKPLEVTLPSGNVVQVRKPSLIGMMRRGIIPTRLYTVVMQVNDGKKKVEELAPEEYKLFLEALAIFVVQSVVDPKLTLESKSTDDLLSIDELSDDDQMTIFTKSQQFAEAAGGAEGEVSTDFRDESDGAPDRHGSDEVPSPTVDPVVDP